MQYFGAVYINTNTHHTVFYTGVSSDLISRIRDHKKKRYRHSFSAKYNVDKLVYYELFFTMLEAIAREKQIKGWSRAKKIRLINDFNPGWKDLYEDLGRGGRHSESATGNE